MEKRKGYSAPTSVPARATFGDEILKAGLLCGCPVQEVIKYLPNGASHPDLMVVHADACPAYERIRVALKRTEPAIEVIADPDMPPGQAILGYPGKQAVRIVNIGDESASVVPPNYEKWQKENEEQKKFVASQSEKVSEEES